jgi:hypothetical protein
MCGKEKGRIVASPTRLTKLNPMLAADAACASETKLGNSVRLSCAIINPLKNAILAFFQPRQARSKAPHGEQNTDLRRDFEITSV